MLTIAVVKGVFDALAALQTLRDTAEWLQPPTDSPLQRAATQTAEQCAGQFPDLRRQLLDVSTSPEFRATLSDFVTRGTVDAGLLVKHLEAAGLYLTSDAERDAAQVAVESFLRAFNEAILRDPATGTFVADARSASRAAFIAEGVASVKETVDRSNAAVQRIEACLRSDPGEDLAAMRKATKDMPLAAALRMYGFLEQQLRGRAGAWTREVEAQLELEKGAAAWREGEVPTAARHFERAYELDPRDVRIRLNSGLAMAVQERIVDGLARIGAVIEEAPGNVRAKIAKAQALHLSNRSLDALRVLRQLTSVAGAESDAYRLHIGAAVAEGLFSEAVEVAERGLRGSTEPVCIAAVAHAYAARADAAFRAGRYDAQTPRDLSEARDAYARAIAAARIANASRVLAESLVAQAYVLLHSSMRDEALVCAREALVLAPQDAFTAQSVAVVALACQKYDEAYAAAEPYAKRGHATAQGIAAAAYCHLNPTATAQQVEDAIASLGLSVASVPPPVFELLLEATLRESTLVAEALVARWVPPSQVYRLLGEAQVAFAREDNAAGIHCLSRACEELRVAPDPGAALRVAELAKRHTGPAVAVEAYDTIPVTAESPDFLTGAYVNALLESGDSEPRVLALAAQAEKAGLFSLPLIHAEATVLEHRGELERAQQLWQALCERTPNSDKYHLAVARCAYRRNRNDEAAAALTRLASPTSLSATELLMVAELRKRLGQMEPALRDAYAA